MIHLLNEKVHCRSFEMVCERDPSSRHIRWVEASKYETASVLSVHYGTLGEILRLEGSQYEVEMRSRSITLMKQNSVAILEAKKAVC